MFRCQVSTPRSNGTKGSTHSIAVTATKHIYLFCTSIPVHYCYPINNFIFREVQSWTGFGSATLLDQIERIYSDEVWYICISDDTVYGVLGYSPVYSLPVLLFLVGFWHRSRSLTMPKRQCPFSESNRPQLKTHVGLIELSSGVMGPQMMNNVYGRSWVHYLYFIILCYVTYTYLVLWIFYCDIGWAIF